MTYILDTNVLSELRKAPQGRVDANVVAWAESVSADDFFISAVTVMELELGVLQMERKDARQGAVLRFGSSIKCCRSFSGASFPLMLL